MSCQKKKPPNYQVARNRRKRPQQLGKKKNGRGKKKANRKQRRQSVLSRRGHLQKRGNKKPVKPKVRQQRRRKQPGRQRKLKNGDGSACESGSSDEQESDLGVEITEGMHACDAETQTTWSRLLCDCCQQLVQNPPLQLACIEELERPSSQNMSPMPAPSDEAHVLVLNVLNVKELRDDNFGEESGSYQSGQLNVITDDDPNEVFASESMPGPSAEDMEELPHLPQLNIAPSEVERMDNYITANAAEVMRIWAAHYGSHPRRRSLWTLPSIAGEIPERNIDIGDGPHNVDEDQLLNFIMEQGVGDEMSDGPEEGNAGSNEGENAEEYSDPASMNENGLQDAEDNAYEEVIRSGIHIQEFQENMNRNYWNNDTEENAAGDESAVGNEYDVVADHGEVDDDATMQIPDEEEEEE